MCVFHKGIPALFAVILGLCAINHAEAKVCFLPNGDCGDDGGFGSGGSDFSIDTSKQCKNEGFELVNCREVEVKYGVCPYDDRYAQGCKCRNDLVECSDVQDGVGESCDGKYASCVCKPGMTACNDAQQGIGISCDGKYKECICKPGLKNCSGLYEGVGDACGGQYESCRCRSDLKTCGDGQTGIGEACNGKYESCTCKDNLKTCGEAEVGIGAECGGMYEDCVCRADLKTCPAGQAGSGLSCGGKYLECGCAENLVSCGEAEVGVGAECGGKYEACRCKDGLTACSGNQIGIGTSCDGKFEACKCPDNWTECLYGAPENALTCSQNGKTVYSTCSDKCGPEYRNIECKKYEEEEKCVNDASMKICVPTCESRLAADGYKVNEDVSGAVITKDTTFSTTNGKNFRSVEDFRTKYPLECSKSKRPKPTLTYQVVGSAGVNLANAKFDKINLNIQSGGKIDFSGTTITNGTLTTSSDIFVGQGHWTFTFKNDSGKASFKAGKIQVVHGADFKITNASMDIKGLFVWNTSTVIIQDTTFKADYLETITSDTRVEFAGNGTSVYVKNTFIGGIENFSSYDGADVYRRGAMIRVRDGAYWYMSAGNVRMRDGAQFCAGFGGRIWFSGGSFGSKYSDQYQGCRIYNKKDRTLSYDNWDPSSYTSWNKRGSC